MRHTGTVGAQSTPTTDETSKVLIRVVWVVYPGWVIDKSFAVDYDGRSGGLQTTGPYPRPRAPFPSLGVTERPVSAVPPGQTRSYGAPG